MKMRHIESPETSQGGPLPAVTPESTDSTGWPGWGPLSGIAFVVLFVATAFMSGTPDTNASDSAWTAWFASAAHRDVLTATAFTGLAAALALMSFIVNIWTRVAAVGRARVTNPLPVAAAAAGPARLGGNGQHHPHPPPGTHP